MPSRRVEQRRDPVVQRRQHDGHAAGQLDRAHVGQPQRHLVLRRLAVTAERRELATPHLRGGDADERGHRTNVGQRAPILNRQMSSQYVFTMYKLSRTHPPDKQVLKGHLAVLHARREDRRPGPQRLRQVDAAADHGRRATPSTAARPSSLPAPASGCSSRSPSSTRARTCAATSRTAWRRPVRCSTASTSSPPTTPTRPRTSSRASRSASTPPTPGTWTRSSTPPWMRCVCPRPTPT